MRQLIARVDDQLHARLKDRAAAEGRSLNSLVTEILELGLDPEGHQHRLRQRLARAGWLVVPVAPKHAPSRDEAIATTRGAGTAVSEAIEADRRSR